MEPGLSRGVAQVSNPLDSMLSLSLPARAIVGLVAMIAAPGSPPWQERDLERHARSLAQSVRAADRNEYFPIAGVWRNPTIFVGLSGIFLFPSGESHRRRPTSLSTLAGDLAGLPESAWPLGRVVVLAQSPRTVSIELKGSPPPPSESEPVREAKKNFHGVIATLKSLNLDVVHAPVG